jgi:DNA-binding transcriptional ArsR family regulator
VFRAVAAPRRRAILRIVWNDEVAASAIYERLGDVTFGAVSQHLKHLTEAGVIEVRREGRNRFYRARHEALGSLREALEDMWSDALYELKLRAEMEEARRGPRRPGRPGRPGSRKGIRR